ncbi:TPR domain protein in aerotolerance operon [Vibrio maritimus]|uniref:TPR domain protein in aerotolerance operon n=1 Tax=Vibrio maritimus TaxID=990268 RepID=A0A090SBT5_9VIBR|nr:TPR domain protein in aerotolerance operon [Vibrio maritimus]
MFDFEFLFPQALWLLLPSLAISLWLKSSQKSSSIIADHLAKALGSDTKQNSLFWWFTPLCLALIIALAGPSFGKAEKPGAQSANSRVLVVDMSQSVYAEDIKPSRLAQIAIRRSIYYLCLNRAKPGWWRMLVMHTPLAL